MKKIYLLRHGDKQKIRSESFAKGNFNLALAPTGILQIQKLVRFLQREELVNNTNSVLCSSPYPRAVQTAEIVRQSLELKEFHVYDEFEEIYFARNYAKSVAENVEIENYYRSNPDAVNSELGLSLNQIITNAKAKMLELANNSDRQNILISCHGGIIRNLAFSLDPSLQPAVNPERWADFVERGGFTELEVNGKELKIIRFNVSIENSGH